MLNFRENCVMMRILRRPIHSWYNASSPHDDTNISHSLYIFLVSTCSEHHVLLTTVTFSRTVPWNAGSEAPTATTSRGNTLIWRLNDGMEELSVAHRLPLAHLCAEWKSELTGRLPCDGGMGRSGQNGAQKSASPHDPVVFGCRSIL